MGSPSRLTEVREAESRRALILFKQLRSQSEQGERPPKTAARTEVGIMDCQILSGGDLNLSLVGVNSRIETMNK